MSEERTWADRMTGWMEAMAPLFDQPHLASVRDGLAALVPLLIIGALSLVVLQFPVQGWLDIVEGDPNIARVLWVPFNMTFGFLSLFAVVAISYALARRRNLEPLMPASLATLAFLIFTNPITGTWGESGFPATYLDNSGLFTAIIVGLVSVEIYNFFVKRNIVIKMPEGVPPAISNAFIALLPGLAILVIAWFVRVILNFDLAGGVVTVLGYVVPAVDTLPAALFAESFHAFLWTLGIHGDLTIGIVLSPIWTSNLADNAAALAQGVSPLPWIYTSEWRSYVVPGGSGATLPLAFYMIRSKSPRLRQVGLLGIWPGIFNINEPITFGAPVIFNPILAIPFIVITFINALVAYLALYFNLVTRIGIIAPWTLPSPILQYIQSNYDWKAAVLALITEFVIPGLIWYLPFKAYEREVLREEGAAD